MKALRHYVAVWESPERTARLPLLRGLEERLLRISRPSELDEELPAGCTIAGAVVDARGEVEDVWELMTATRQRWPAVPLLACGSQDGRLERRVQHAGGGAGISWTAGSGHAAVDDVRAFAERAIAARLTRCERFDERMAAWKLSEREAQMLVLLAFGMSESLLPAALETTARYVGEMRRSIVTKTGARDLFGVLARLNA